MSLHVNVIMGGPSAEHEVSLKSGREVLENMDKKRYAVRAVVATKDLSFFYCDVKRSIPSLKDLSRPGKSTIFKGPFAPGASLPVWKKCDVAFLAVHGSFGEDGLLQGFLDTLKIRYTGSGVFASAVAMNKIASKFIFQQNGIMTPPFCIVGKDHPETTASFLEKKFGYPLYVKCPQSGSSRLMARVESRKDFLARLKEYRPYSSEILVEKEIKGIEFSCPVLEYPDGSERALPPIEIRPVANTYFSFKAKYEDGGSQELVPAPRPEKLLSKIKDIALKAHRLLNCRGTSRTDMILGKDGKLYVLELNSLPGLTANSLLPKSFRAAGGTYPQLIEGLIRSALKKPLIKA
jgi:D-alanine-D-alanine ligase